MVFHYVEVTGFDEQRFPVLEYKVVIIGRLDQRFVCDDAVEAVRSMAEREMHVGDLVRIRTWEVVNVKQVNQL